MPKNITGSSYDDVPPKELAKFFVPMYTPIIYNVAMLGLIEKIKASAPGIFIPCRCPEGARFANLMQDMLLKNSSQLMGGLENMLIGTGLGAMVGAAVGAVYGSKESGTARGKAMSTLSGALGGGFVGQLLSTSFMDTALFSNALEYFGPWSGHGLDGFTESLDYGVQNVAGMALLYPLFMAFTVAWPVLYILYKSRKSIASAIKDGNEVASVLKKDGAI